MATFVAAPRESQWGGDIAKTLAQFVAMIQAKKQADVENKLRRDALVSDQQTKKLELGIRAQELKDQSLWRNQSLALNRELGLGELGIKGKELGIRANDSQLDAQVKMQQLGLQTRELLSKIGFQGKQLDLASRELAGNLMNKSRELGIEQTRTLNQQQYQQGQLALGQDQNSVDRLYKTGQLGIAQQEANQQGSYQLGQLKLGAQQNAADAQYKQGMLGLGEEQNDIDASYKRGQLGIAQQAENTDQMYKTGQLGLSRDQLNSNTNQWMSQVAIESEKNAQNERRLQLNDKLRKQVGDQQFAKIQADRDVRLQKQQVDLVKSFQDFQMKTKQMGLQEKAGQTTALIQQHNGIMQQIGLEMKNTGEGASNMNIPILRQQAAQLEASIKEINGIPVDRGQLADTLVEISKSGAWTNQPATAPQKPLSSEQALKIYSGWMDKSLENPEMQKMLKVYGPGLMKQAGVQPDATALAEEEYNALKPKKKKFGLMSRIFGSDEEE